MADETPETNINNSVQIILIGPTGSGKSSSGNTILGKKIFKSEASGKSVTQKSQQGGPEIISGRKVTVVDTPGWDYTELSKYDSKQKFNDEIKHILQNLRGPYSFLLVLKIGSVESPQIKEIYDLRNVLGESFMNHTTILFTHRDDLEFKTFEEFLKEGDSEFQKLLNDCARRRHSWNNRETRSDKDVEKILNYLKESEKRNDSPRSSQYSMKNDEAEKDDNVVAATSEKRFKWEDTTASDGQISLVQVLFLGMTKEGKTTCIRTLQSKCDQTENKDIHLHRETGLSLHLIDSPISINETITDIHDVVSKFVSLCAPGPHVIIIVMRVGRFTTETKTIMKQLQNFLGPNATKHTMILFTGKDDLENKPIKRFIEENPELEELVKGFGNRFHAFNNRDPSDQEQVKELLQKIQDIYKSNQREIYKIEDEYRQQHQHDRQTKEANNSGASNTEKKNSRSCTII